MDDLEKLLRKLFGKRAWQVPDEIIQELKNNMHMSGYRMTIGPEGETKVEEFGDRPSEIDRDTKEPVSDIIEKEDVVTITAEMPGVDKQDIEIELRDEEVEIEAENDTRHYHTILDLPCEVEDENYDISFRNGILDFKLKKREGNNKKISL